MFGRQAKFCQDLSQAFQENGLLFVYGDNSVQAAAIPTKGFDDGEVFELFDDPPGGQLQSSLTNLTFQQAVGEQGQHVEKQHSLDTLVFVKVNR